METTRTDVANIIWKQISLHSKMACGARELQVTEKGLTFRVMRAMRWVEIELDASDTYTVRLVRLNRSTHAMITVEQVSDVYADVLSETVYKICNK